MDIGTITFRQATVEDLDSIVYMLSDDNLGKTRECYDHSLPENYIRAFHAIDADSNIVLIVACVEDTIVGVAQITFTPHLTYQGGWRATIEGVRTASSERSKGLGSQLIRYAIERAKERGCHMVQLTTDKKRVDALRFYERLGFKVSHEGLKLHL